MQINGLEVVTSQEHPGRTRASRSSSPSTRTSTPPRPTCRRRSRRRPAACRPTCRRRRLIQDQSERPADHVHRADQRLGHAGPALRLREHAGRPAPQHPARREPGGRLRHQVGHPHQGRPVGACGRAASRSTISSTAIRSGTSYTGRRPVRRSPSGTALLRPQGQLDNAEAVRQPDRRRSSDGAPVYLRDVADGRGIGPGRARQHAVLGARLRRCPSATVVARRQPPGRRQRGRRSPRASASMLPGHQRRASRRRSGSRPIYDRSQTIVHSRRTTCR